MGGIYALLGLAIVVIYKATRIFNLAQGGLLAVGAYSFYLFLVQLNLPLSVAILLLFLSLGGIGLLMERIALRPLIGQPILASVIVTLALLGILSGMITAIWGAVPRGYPLVLGVHGTINLGGVIIPQILIFGFVVTMVLFLAFAIFFHYHKYGLAMRATAEDHQVSQSLGIGVRKIFSICWIVAGLVGAVTGLTMGYIQTLHQYLPEIGLKAFAVVLVGGLESIPGALTGGLIVGITESLVGAYVPIKGLGELMAWIIVLVVLLFKPYGLWGLQRIERI
jgi:branched-chain amino acid transport system permease protein